MQPFTESGFKRRKRRPGQMAVASNKIQAAPRFLGFVCTKLSCSAATMSMTLLRTGGGGALALLPLGLVIDQSFHVIGVGVVIFVGIEFCRHALDQLQGKIDFVGDQLLVDRQAELVGRAYFRGETEGV